MTRLTCAACNAPLEEGRSRYMRCTNRNCPAGGEFRRCGYCGAYSQAIVDGAAECYNSACRFHHVRLSVCPDCKRYALMSRRGVEPFCLWRECPSNNGRVQECEFCGNRSFLRADGIDMCAKSKCPALLKQMLQCAFCHRWMVDGSTDKCQNVECDHHDETIVECASCSLRMYSFDHDKCWNPDCPSRSTASTASTVTHQPTIMQEDVEDMQTLISVDPEPASPPKRESERPASTFRPPPAAPPEPTPRRTPDPQPTAPPSPRADAPSVTFRPLDPADRPPREEAPPRREARGGFSPPSSVRMPSPRRGGRGGSPQIDMADAFRAVREGILTSPEGQDSPLLLVMGTAGSGKTAFLATLGKILNAGEALFAFPHRGVAAEPISWDSLVGLLQADHPMVDPHDLKKELRARVEDLVFSYSTQIYDQYIARGIWCEFTRPDFGQFLVANVTRQGHPLANIVTLETSGENFESLLGAINDLGEVAHSGTPIVKTMADMLSHARGLVIVMDPSSPTNDRVYQPFFTHLARHLGHRVHVALDEDIRTYLERTAVRRRLRSGGQAKERISQFHREGAMEAARKELEELASGLKRLGALAVERDRVRFQSVLDAVSRGNREVGANIQSKLDKSGGDPALEVEIWNHVLAKAGSHIDEVSDVLFPEVARSEDELAISSEQAIARQVCVKHGVPAEIAKHFNLEAGPTALTPQFPRLRDIALVFSKSDMHPVVYPPDGYPRQKLPATCGALEKCEHYLKFLGGELRYYNTSVLGYSACANGQYFPGNEASLTPVNVIEPVFDMLSDKLNSR